MKLLALFIGVVSALELSRVAEPIKDEYVIQFKSNVSEALRSAHISEVETHSTVMHKYDFPGFAGYSAVITSSESLSSVMDSPHILVVEENGIMRISDQPVHGVDPQACTTQTGATWGLVRTAEEDLSLTGEYKYDTGVGAGVKTYVIDTGIYCGHNDFGNRCTWGYNAVDSDNSDGNGHGTHVAGTMVGSTYGLAKSATTIAVKVLNAGGSGSTAGVIAGINWVVNDAINMAKKVGKMLAKAVGNMSLGGGRSTTMNNAVNAAHDGEVIMVVAAGNSAADACNYSPASAENSICLGSTTNTDSMSSFSNYGSCIDIFGPGSSITSCWIGGPSSTNTISGTSMASPHAAGVAAKLMWEHPDYDADKIKAEMLDIASQNKLSGVRGSPNKLTYHGCFDL